MRHWGKKELSYLKAYYQNLYDRAEEKDKIEIASTINSIDFLLAESTSRININLPPRLGDIILEDYDFLNIFGSYCQYVRYFSRIFEDTIPYQVTDWNYRYTSEKSILKFADIFYKIIGGKFYATYKSLREEFPDTINFLNIHNCNGTIGLTYNIYKTDIILFDIYVCNNIQDYATMVHELGHGINLKANGDVLGETNKYCLSEVEGIFFELLACDFLEKCGLGSEGLKSHLAYYKNFGYISLMYTRKLDMMNDLLQHQAVNKRIAVSYLRENYGKNKKEIKDTLYIAFESYFKYIISYLVAIELYIRYYQDKDTTLDTLWKILATKSLKPEEYISFLKSLNIIPGENLVIYRDEMLKKEEREDERKRILRYKL